MLRIVLPALFFLVVLGCGELIGSDDNADVKIGGLNAKIVSEQKFRLEGTSDNNGNSSHSFEASFHLNEDPITFYFFSNKSLEGGIQLDISRNDDSQTQFEYQLNEKKFTKVIEKLDNSKITELGFEIHNNETDTHTLIWINKDQEDDEHGHDEHGHDEHGDDEHGHDEHTDMATCMSDGTCLFNTAEIEELKNTGQGVGSFWGIKVKTMTDVKKLSGPTKAKHSH